MSGINKINPKLLRNAALHEFGLRYIGWTDEFVEIKGKIAPVLNGRFIPAVQQLDLGIKDIRGWDETETLAGWDNRRDNATFSINGTIAINLRHPQPEFVASAKRLQRVAKRYKRIHEKEYNEQTGDTRNYLQEFRGEYKTDVEKLVGLTFWVDELELSNNEFAKLYDARDSKTAAKITVDVKAARFEICDSLEVMINYLNGLAAMEGEEKYETAFKKLNVIISHYGGDNEKHESNTDENKYPDAPEWLEDLPFMGVENGDIYYIMVDGKKVFYKLIDKQKFFWHPESERAAGGWEKL